MKKEVQYLRDDNGNQYWFYLGGGTWEVPITHREDGPATITHDGKKMYYLHGIYYSLREYNLERLLRK